MREEPEAEGDTECLGAKEGELSSGQLSKSCETAADEHSRVEDWGHTLREHV